MKKINFRIFLVGFLVLFLIVIVTVIIVNQSKQSEQKNTNNTISEPQNVKITQYIETSPDKFSVFKDTINSGKTALDLLQNTVQVQTQGEGQNAFVVEINGRMADNNKRQFWAFYINDKQASVGAGSYILKDGDIIQWKLESY